MPLTWVLTGDRYEVSSVEHLLQIMNKGALYTDAGTPPTDYWAKSYIQTQDIDLANDQANIAPIGISTSDAFSGDYDGNYFKISNWTYTGALLTRGLFGTVSNGKIARVRLAGVWVVEMLGDTGFLCAYVASSSSIYDIEAEFSTGTSITETDASGEYAGVLIGRMLECDVYGLTVRGTIHTQITTLPHIGGVVGYVSGYWGPSTLTMARNLATFPSGLNGRTTGGIVGVTGYNATISKVMNGMIGDIMGSGTTGGIVGSPSGGTIDSAVNSMTGNISTASNADVGGIAGRVSPSNGNNFTGIRMLNYMTGDILVGYKIGGLLGAISRSSTQTTAEASFTNSIVAMNGATVGAVVGDVTFTPTAVTSTKIDTYGLTTSSNSYTTTSLPSDPLLLTNPDYPIIPYFEMTGTDPDGTVYDWDFLYGNIGGASSYSQYTHLVLHKGDIEWPLLVQDVPETNTLYTTYLNYTNDLVFRYVAPLTVDARAVNISVAIGPVDGAIEYRVTYEGPSGVENTTLSGLTTLSHNITGVDPETTYTVRLYVNTGSGYVLTEALTATTLPNIATNYNVTDFAEGGVFKLASLPDSVLGNIYDFMDELFTTGDVVNIVNDVNTSFVNLGDELSIKEISGVLMPFETSSGTGQTVSVVLSDTTTTTVYYDDTMNSITVNSVEYFPGDSFILDGRKITVIDA